jgi:hypothetical protein
MDGYNTYNGGIQVGVRPFQQTSSRTGEFFQGAYSANMNPGNGPARTLHLFFQSEWAESRNI